MPLYEELKDRLDFVDDENWASLDIAQKGFTVVHQLSGAILVVYSKIRGDAAAQAELSTAIEQLYNEFVAPLDIPKLGPVAEALVDSQLGKILGGIVKPLDAALDKVLPNPAE